MPNTQNTADSPSLYSEIIQSLVQTRTEANLLLSEIDILLRSVYKSGTDDFENTLRQSVRAKTAYAVKHGIGKTDKEEFLLALKKNTESLDYVKLTIAFEPSLASIERISSWIKENVGTMIAFDFTVDPKILGGAVVEYSGKIKDFTIVPLIDLYYKDHADI